MKTVVKTMRLKKEIVEKIGVLAEKENRSFSNMVETILQKFATYPDFFLTFKQKIKSDD